MDELVISADSHVMEPHDLWEKALASRFGDAAPRFKRLDVGESFQAHAGGHDPNARLDEMSVDGVSAEVLYPTNGLLLFNEANAELQEASFRVYNDWLIDYCSVAPDKLVGIAALSVYDIDAAVAEVERCREAGLRGAIVWETPHPDLPFHSEHYERLWSALEEWEMPLSFHIFTGFNSRGSRKNFTWDVELCRATTNIDTMQILDTVFDFVFYGVLERHPGLKLVTVEHEMGFWPWMLQQWDYYHNRFKKRIDSTLQMDPSEYCARQLYTTFFNDHVGAQSLGFWEDHNCMWSNDFPHPNSPWPNSRTIIERDLGHLPPDVRADVVSGTVMKLYDMDLATIAG